MSEEPIPSSASSATISASVVTPRFATDCIITLEEITMEAAETFQNACGRHYSYIPCLKNSEASIELLSKLIEDQSSMSANLLPQEIETID